MQSNDSNVLDEVALARVHGGNTALALAKGATAGALLVAPIVVPKLIGAADESVTSLATAGITWGLLGGWAVRGVRAMRR